MTEAALPGIPSTQAHEGAADESGATRYRLVIVLQVQS